MNTPTSLPPCRGLFGHLLGHRFKARYSESTDFPPGTMDALRQSIDTALSRSLISTAFGITDRISSTYESMGTQSVVYVHDVCTRCGCVVEKQK